jgi:hypothetical protein
MRVKTYTKNIYTLDEVKDAAVEKNWDINVDHEWWDYVYEDAAEVGLKITSFDLGRSWDITGKLTSGAAYTMEQILLNHGQDCKTYKTAEQYQKRLRPVQAWLDKVYTSKHDLLSKSAVYDKYRACEDLKEEIEAEFLKDVLGDYLHNLRDEYEYLTSAEAIEETLRVNEYEFNEDGTIA